MLGFRTGHGPPPRINAENGLMPSLSQQSLSLTSSARAIALSLIPSSRRCLAFSRILM